MLEYKIYGDLIHRGFAIGDNHTKYFIGSYAKNTALKLLADESFIQRWNDNHIAKIDKLIIEISEV